MIIETFVLSPFQQNTRVVVCEKMRRAVCVDPGAESVELINFLRENSFELQAVTLTHGHLDHVGGTSALKRAFPDAEIILHKDDEDLYYALPRQPLAMGLGSAQIKMLGMDYEAPPALTRHWEHGEIYAVGELEFEIRHSPGHTRGHVVMAEMREKKVFVGDCLFEGSIGRTDLPGGSFEQLMDSINRQILTLGDDFTVYSGHGRETTIGHEKRTNPFLTGVYQMTRGKFM